MTDIKLNDGFQELSFDESLEVDGGIVKAVIGFVGAAIAEATIQQTTGKSSAEWIIIGSQAVGNAIADFIWGNPCTRGTCGAHTRR